MGASKNETQQLVERSRRWFQITAGVGLLQCSVLLLLVRVFPDGFASVFSWYLPGALEAAVAKVPWELRASFRSEYAPFLVRHFVDHASGYLATVVAGFAALCVAGRRPEWVSASGWCTRAWIGLALITPLVYFVTDSATVPISFAVASGLLIAVGVRSASASRTNAPPKKKRAKAEWERELAGRVRAEGWALRGWVAVVLLAGAVLVLLKPAGSSLDVTQGAFLQQAHAPAALGSKTANVVALSGPAKRLLGTWQLDGAAEVESPDMKAFIASTPDPKQTKQAVLTEAKGDLFEFQSGGRCLRQHPAPASMPSAKPRVRRCGWKLLEEAGETLKLSLSDDEVVVVRFLGDDAIQLTTPEGKGAQRFIRIEGRIPDN